MFPAPALMSMSVERLHRGPNDGPGQSRRRRLHSAARVDGVRRTGPGAARAADTRTARAHFIDEAARTGAVARGRAPVEQVDTGARPIHAGMGQILVASHRTHGPKVANYPLVHVVKGRHRQSDGQAKARGGDRECWYTARKRTRRRSRGA